MLIAGAGREDYTLTILGYLEKDRFYYLGSKRFGSFCIWDPNWRKSGSVPIEDVLQEARRLKEREKEGEFLIILPLSPLEEKIKLRYSLAEIGGFERAIVGGAEEYYLYLMR